MHDNVGDIHAIDWPVLSDFKAGIAHRFQAAIYFCIRLPTYTNLMSFTDIPPVSSTDTKLLFPRGNHSCHWQSPAPVLHPLTPICLLVKKGEVKPIIFKYW